MLSVDIHLACMRQHFTMEIRKRHIGIRHRLGLKEGVVSILSLMERVAFTSESCRPSVSAWLSCANATRWRSESIISVLTSSSARKISKTARLRGSSI